MGERLLCTQEVTGSTPVGSTTSHGYGYFRVQTCIMTSCDTWLHGAVGQHAGLSRRRSGVQVPLESPP